MAHGLKANVKAMCVSLVRTQITSTTGHCGKIFALATFFRHIALVNRQSVLALEVGVTKTDLTN